MHAIVVQVSFKPGREQEAVDELDTNIIPGVKRAAGFAGGYWMRTGDLAHGVSVELFDTLDNANAEMGRRSTTLPEQAPLTIDTAIVCEVVGHA